MQSTIMDCKLLLFFQKSHKHPQTNKESAIFLTVNLLLHSLILGETFLHWKKRTRDWNDGCEKCRRTTVGGSFSEIEQKKKEINPF